ncbi:MAG: hypothetical protein IKO73_02255 [Bacteroidaceae bacterium]|nr:hypothetical protein [Bacteroidaceae bacterium]
MNKYQLYKLLRKNESLKEKRHPMFEKNRFMKFLLIFFWLYYAAILLFMGVTMAIGMKGAYNGVAAFHVLDGWFLVVLMIDFWIRFILQDTPVNQAKPYTLLPIRRSFLMNVYLIRSGFSIGNLYWGFMLVPFGLIAIAVPFGWITFIGWLLGWWLLCIANGFCYLFVRTLLTKHMAWLLLPIVVHGAIIAAMFVPDHSWLDMPCTILLNGFANWNVLYILAVLAFVAFLYYANFLLQNSMVYNEISKEEEVKVKNTAKMSFLNRYGRIGEYMKLEVRMKTRNKTPKMQFAMGIGFMLFFSVIMYFTDVYDNGFMKSFICLYSYIFLGVTTLIGIMCHEGNYIDGLMSRRESIYQLLRAKYYFNSMLLIIPPIILMPLMIIGKMSVWMNLGYLFFTAGVLYPILFQLAVYNKDTFPLNQKLTGKQGNATQQIISMVILFLPIGFEKLATVSLGDPWGYILLMCLGIIGVATHKIWIKNIYQRFMLRRHINMEGFRASRNS